MNQFCVGFLNVLERSRLGDVICREMLPFKCDQCIPGGALLLESFLSLLKKQLMNDCRNLYQCSILQSGFYTNGQSDLLKRKYARVGRESKRNVFL